MANVFRDIQAALDGKLKVYQSSNVAWENAGYTPVIGTAYLEPLFMPGQPTPAGLGSSAKNRHVGIYQINVYQPLGSGAGDGVAIADALVSFFKRGTIITQNGINVRCRQSWREKAQPEGSWYVIPVSVLWWADAANA